MASSFLLLQMPSFGPVLYFHQLEVIFFLKKIDIKLD